jgi:hypothetical protein
MAKTNPALSARRVEIEHMAETLDRLCDEVRNDPTNDKPWDLIRHIAHEIEHQASLGHSAALRAQVAK